MLRTREPTCPAVLQSDLAKGGVSSESTLANDPYLLKALRVGFELVLRRSIETARITGHVPFGVDKRDCGKRQMRFWADSRLFGN
jgi:hypothetical protein